MPRAALSTEDLADFRARLVTAATRLFVEQGWDAVTMRGVAAALGVSPMTPYRYVAGKDELLALVRTEAFRRLADTQLAALGARGSPRTRLRRSARAYLDFALAEADAYRVMFELAQQPAGHYPELDRESARAFAPLVDAVRAAVTAGELDGDALTLAHLYWAGMHGLVSLHLAGKLGLGRSLETLFDEQLERWLGSRRRS